MGAAHRPGLNPDGEREPPNPLDPTTLGVRESVVLSEDYYSRLDAKASYRQLQARLGDDEGRRVSSGVQRVSPATVRVLVGTRNSCANRYFSVSAREYLRAGLTTSGEVSEGQLDAVNGVVVLTYARHHGSAEGDPWQDVRPCITRPAVRRERGPAGRGAGFAVAVSAVSGPSRLSPKRAAPAPGQRQQDVLRLVRERPGLRGVKAKTRLNFDYVVPNG